MKYLGNEYIKVYVHKGFNICILRKSRTCNSLFYVIDDMRYVDRKFRTAADAINEINSSI